MRLYGIEGNYKTNKILAIANFAGLQVELVPSAYNNAPSKEFIKKYPNAKLPSLETEQGYLFGVAPIVRYLGLVSKNVFNETSPYIRSLIDQWIDFSEVQIEAFAGVLFCQATGIKKFEKEKWDALTKDLNSGLKLLDNILKTKTYIVGESLTLADLSIAGSLQAGFKLFIDPKTRGQFPHLTRWFSNISSLPPFIKAFDKTEFCTQEIKLPLEQQA